MKLLDSIKIQLALKRYSYQELLTLKQFVDKELKKRNKNLLNKN